MKRIMLLVVSALALTLMVMAFSCDGEDNYKPPTPTPEPEPTSTATPVPTATAIPPTATPIPPTPTNTPVPIVPTSDPLMGDYRLIKSVGVAQNAYDKAWPWPRHGGLLDQFTTKELFDELSSYGINTIRLWLSVPYDDGFNGPPQYEDVREIWGHPGIKTIFVNILDPRWAPFAEPSCSQTRSVNGTDEPTYEIATFLYENFGDQDKTIIFIEPEMEWLSRGYSCDKPHKALWHLWDKSEECRAEKTDEECAYDLAMENWVILRERAERRQRDVMRARAENPDANLTVASAVVVAAFEEKPEFFGKFAVRDMIPLMDPSPDYIGLSQGASGGRDFAFPIMQTQKYTGFPINRLFVDQVYVNEKTPGFQYGLIKPAIEVAFNWDIQTVVIWMWKQGWRSYDAQGRPENKGMWNWANDPDVPGKVVYGDPTSGMDVIRELHPDWQEPPEATPTPTATPVPPTATPTATPADPCGHCPDPASWSCQMWPDTCIQCWNACGQPYVTPTPTRTPTRVMTATPTPDPSDPCGHCPDPDSFSCRMWPHTCEPCWEECGQPLATPTPVPPTPTPTPPPLNDHPTLSFNFQGSPVACDVILLHEASGFVKETTVPECKPDIQLTFEKVGVWQIQLTAQYAHGWAVGETEEPPISPEDAADPLFVRRLQGDVDGDGLYEHVYVRRINILPRPDSEGPTA